MSDHPNKPRFTVHQGGPNEDGVWSTSGGEFFVMPDDPNRGHEKVEGVLPSLHLAIFGPKPPKPKLRGVGEFLAFVLLVVGLGAALITFLVFCWWLVMGMVR